VHVANGFGKLAGALQVEELGELESIIALTNTLSVGDVMRGVLDHHVPAMPDSHDSINVLVGETNDGYLNDIKARRVRPRHVLEAIRAASRHVPEGCVGAGTGTRCFGYKGGIGTASRRVPPEALGLSGRVHVGALVQSNYDGYPTIYGHAVARGPASEVHDGGSCMIVLATSAPLDSRQALRLARRGIVGLTRTGSDLAHNSGDFCIAFSNAPTMRRRLGDCSGRPRTTVGEEQLSVLFSAAIEAVAEALYNSLTMAISVTGHQGHHLDAFDPRLFADRLPLRARLAEEGDG